MNTKIEESPTWDSDTKLPSFKKLESSIDVDVLIIGGGITGITCSYLLRNSGKKVALIEKSKLCFGATGVTTAFLTQSIDTSLGKLVKMFGKEETRLIYESHKLAIDETERIIKKEKISCSFRRCSNFIYSANGNLEFLKEENDILKELGTPSELKNGKFGFFNCHYIELFNQAKFHPLKYLYKLIKISSKKVKFFENTEAVGIVSEGNYVVVKTLHGNIKARHVIVATYAPFDKKLFFRKAFYDSYVFELKVKSGLFNEGIYEDTLNPYHYFRVDKMKGDDRIIIGGEDHRSDLKVNRNKSFNALKSYMDKLIPKKYYQIVRKWYGPIVEPADGLALIGTINDSRIFYVSGFSGNGMTYSYIASRIITDTILGNLDSKWKEISKIYNPNRSLNFKQLVSKGIDYSKEMINGAIRNTIKYKG